MKLAILIRIKLEIYFKLYCFGQKSSFCLLGDTKKWENKLNKYWHENK